jgi:hypothetical protein
MSQLRYESKDLPGALVKLDAGAGSGTALFARYRVLDADNDYTEEGFLPHGVTVPLLVSHVWSEIPVGKGRIRSERDGAYYDFTLADSAKGRELAAWLRHDMADGQPNSQWSYGFKILPGGSSQQMRDGQRVRVLHAAPDGPGAHVMEVSYVLAGAGFQTQLVAMKGQQRYHWQRRHDELTRQLAAYQRAQQQEARAAYARWQRLSIMIDHTLRRS